MDKKLRILDILRNSQNALSLNDIYVALNKTIPNRTLLRYLHVLYEEGYINFLGKHRNRRYEAIKKVQANFDQKHSIFSNGSVSILQKLQTPLHQREHCTYNQQWLAQYIPNETFYFTETHRQTLHQHGEQTIARQPAGTYAHKIFEQLLIDLSYNSSRLEGNTYSILDTKQLVLYGKAAADKLDSDRVMILNHKDAIRFLVDGINKIAISEKDICTLHYLLSDGLVLPEDSGCIRRDPVRVSSSVYIPIDNHTLLQNIFNTIIKKASQIDEPFEQSLFLLVHLSYLQAYIDVNKRTARLASNIPLIKNNLVPLSFNEVEVDDYRSALISIYEFNEIQPLIDLYIWSYVRTSILYKASAESMGFDELRIKYRSQRRKLVNDIVKNQITTGIKQHVQKYAQHNIPTTDIEKFVSDCLIDLNSLDAVKIAGLGISNKELQAWQENVQKL